jgi:hypothetical protein
MLITGNLKCDRQEKLDVRINGVSLTQVNQMCYLGLVIDDKLSWGNHVNSMSTSISFKITLLSRLSKILPNPDSSKYL